MCRGVRSLAGSLWWFYLDDRCCAPVSSNVLCFTLPFLSLSLLCLSLSLFPFSLSLSLSLFSFSSASPSSSALSPYLSLFLPLSSIPPFLFCRRGLILAFPRLSPSVPTCALRCSRPLRPQRFRATAHRCLHTGQAPLSSSLAALTAIRLLSSLIILHPLALCPCDTHSTHSTHTRRPFGRIHPLNPPLVERSTAPAH